MNICRGEDDPLPYSVVKIQQDSLASFPFPKKLLLKGGSGRGLVPALVRVSVNFLQGNKYPDQGDRKGLHPSPRIPPPLQRTRSIVHRRHRKGGGGVECGVGTFTVALGVLGAKI